MRLILCLLLVFTFTADVFAEQEAAGTELEEITVTATKTPRKVEEVSSAMDVISKDEVEKSRSWNIGEVLENLPGVQSQSSNGAYDTHIIIRGSGAKALYGVREIMIMVDGIPITDPDSMTRLDMVDTSIIERIEVVKGPNSTLYGANAAGGIINIITKSPFLYQGAKLRASYGSFNSQDYHLQYGGSSGDLSYLLSGTRRSTDSWREHNEFETNQFSTRFNYLIDDSSDIELTLSYNEAELELPGRLTEEEFEDDHTQQASTWQHTARNSKSKRASLAYKKEFTGGSDFRIQAYAQEWYHYHPVPIRINDGGANVYGADIQNNFLSTVSGKKSVLSIGLSGQKDIRDSKSYTYGEIYNGIVNGQEVALPPYSKSDEKGEVAEHTQNTVEKWGLFLQESLWIGEGTILDLGIRYDQVHFDLKNDIYKDWSFITANASGAYFNYVDDRRTIKIDETWEAVSPRVGLNHAITDGANVYANVSTGFQTPTQSEIETNEDLDPQKAVNYEVGFRGTSSSGHSLGLAVYYTKIEDEIIQLLEQDGTAYFDNAGETLHKGGELTLLIKLMQGLTFGANYAYSDYKFVDYTEMERAGFPPTLIKHERDGNRIPLVPLHQYSLSLNYKHSSGFYSRLSSVTWGEYYIDTPNTEKYEGFTTYSGRIGYDGKKLGLFAQVDNIFDKKYASEVVMSYGNVRYSPGAPRTYTAGLSYAF